VKFASDILKPSTTPTLERSTAEGRDAMNKGMIRVIVVLEYSNS
jgi:hypothetical protein